MKSPAGIVPAWSAASLHYLPQVEIGSGRIVGLEVLACQTDPSCDTAFVPIPDEPLKDRGQTRDAWILAQTCRQIQEWSNDGLVVPPLAIGVPACALAAPRDYERLVAGAFATWHVRSPAIELEITEAVLMEVTQRHGDAIERLQALGASIAIDDFASSYASLDYLGRHPIQSVKIATKFVSGLGMDSRNDTVVRLAACLARDLGMRCIAKGVETAMQVRLLSGFGCVHGQGNFFSPPLSARQTARMLLPANFKALSLPLARQ